MANQVTGFDGYNLYRHNPDTTVTKLNMALINESEKFSVDQLLNNTDYSGVFEIRPVDKAGNETVPGFFVNTGAAGLTGTPHTLNPTPDQAPMSTADVTAIDDIVARCMAAGDSATGVTIGIVSPKGFLYKSYGSGTGVNSYYRVASQTKTFTGHVILMMLDAGLIGSLDDPLSTYLPGYNVDPTIHQIMTHESGLYDYELSSGLAQNFTLTPTTAYSVDQIMAIIQGGAKMFDPGTGFYYTNSNYYVLGKIAESLDPTHRPLDQIIKEDILDPLGMVNTYLQIGTGTPKSPYAVGQDFDPISVVLNGIFFGLWPITRRDVSNQNSNFIWAAGSIISTISDMILWGKELRDCTLLDPATKELRYTLGIDQPLSGTLRWGLKYQGPDHWRSLLAAMQEGSWFGHDGSWLGYDGCVMFEPVTGTVIVVYENFQTGAPHVLAAISTFWYEIATYMYPGSTDQPGYLTGEAPAGHSSMSLKKMSTNIVGNYYGVGSYQPVTQIYTAGQLASVTGATPPPGWLADGAGVYVKGIGKGGSSDAGGSLNTGGGSGGAGAAGFSEYFISKADLLAAGSTFDASYGSGSTPDTIFKFGSIIMKAGGAVGATPGVCTMTNVPGVGPTQYTGAVPGADSTGLAGAGGGHGGQSSGFAVYNGSKGGDSATETGGAANSGVPTDADFLNGGAGGGGGLGNSGSYGSTGGTGAKGGKYGGGAGGGGSGWDGAGGGNTGGIGGLQLRWA